MPNLDALLARSAYGTLRSAIPPMTSAAWTSMMTGCGPPVTAFSTTAISTRPAGRMKVNHSGRVRVPTFWHLLSKAGRSVVSLNVPVTFPPLDVRGVVVSGMDAPHLDAALSGSPEFARRLREEVPGYTLRITGNGPAISRRIDRERPAHLRALPRPRRRGPARRQGRARLVGADGPVPEPRPVPAPGLELPERRRDRGRPPDWNPAARAS